MTDAWRPSAVALSPEQEARLDALCDRFEQAWQAGEQPRLEEYLAEAAELERRVAAWELLRVETHYRRKAGETLRASDYQPRLPMLDPARIVQALGGDLAAPLGPDDPTRLGTPSAPSRSASHEESAPLSAPPGYEILGLLGRGGMGVVYKARQQSLDRPVALKFLPEESVRDPEWLARFRREARTASALNHPHICTIYDTGESAGRPFLSMEFVEGKTLDALIGKGLPVEDLAELLAQAARALAAAHAAGVVHRDIKPANLMVRDDGIVKVLDFGLARRLPTAAAQSTVPGGRSTDPGARVGTLLYMSPEQAKAAPLDAASDIFSLGLVLYELSTGQHPFRAGSEIGVLHAIVAQTPLPPSRLNPEIPDALEALILHMLAKDPRLRPTALEVDAALSGLTRTTGRRPGNLGADTGRPPIVGRQQEEAALGAAFDQAADGRGLLLCVTGEPGLGKTALVEKFVGELAAGGQNCRLAHGRCSERLAGAEAYLPFLEALDSLLQGPDGAAVAQAMKLLAPTWYVQLAPLAADDPALARVLAEAKEASQERRKRELGVFLQELSRQRPLVLFLDDVHWADPSSVDLLAYLGTKCIGWRLLIILTYRSSDLLRSQHAFGPVKLELQGRGVCREIALPFLSREDFDRYLALAFAGHQFPDELATVLHARTEGNPLFMVDLLRYLRDRGVIVQDHGRWALVRAVPDLQRELPESVRGMIQRKVDQLSETDRHLLMAASVQGPEFDSAVLAEMLGQDAAEVEERLDVLERVHALVRLLGERTFPDGAPTVRYGFVHVLYQNAFYSALQPTRKAAWSAAAGRALLRHYGDKSVSLAAKLATLFEAARDPQRAADYYLLAAENATRIFAHLEAVALARRGLALLQTLPDSAERARRELPLQMTLGMQLQVTQGYAAAEAEHTYARARVLCEQMEATPPLFPVLWGLWLFYKVRSNLGKARELAEQLFCLAQEAQDSAQLVQARQALAVTSLCIGDPAATREHMEHGVALYDPKKHHGHTFLYGQDPKVACLAFGAVALWLLGYPDQAVQRSRDAVALGGELAQPSTLALALHFGGMLRQYRREAAAVQMTAEAATAIAVEHGFSFWLAGGMVLRGWALAEHKDATAGIAQLRQGLTAFAATGSETYRTYFLGLLAEALARQERIDGALAVLAESLALIPKSGEGFHEAELHRLRGELLLRQQPSEGARREAETCFRRAQEISRRQQAKSLELRAAMSLVRLFQAQGRASGARSLLADCYDWFTEGFDTPDLQEAKALLDQTA